MSKKVQSSTEDVVASLVLASLDNIAPKVSRAVPHNAILSDDSWIEINERVMSKKATLVQIHESMERNFRDNNLAFFKDFSQFYAFYRKAVVMLGLPSVQRIRKPKEVVTEIVTIEI